MKKRILIAAGLIAVGMAVWMLRSAPTAEVDRFSEREQANPVQSGEQPTSIDRPIGDLDQSSSSNSNNALAMEPLDIREYRDDRGYYRSEDKHPYEYMDDETLRGLSEQQDGIAQLVLADRLSSTDLKEAAPLYLEAAVNGKTAALINIASSQLVARPGRKGFGFPLVDDSGAITERYAEILQYYAAAEMLGDFAGTDLLMEHMSAFGLADLPANLLRICAKGKIVADDIETIRRVRWGESLLDADTTITSVEVPAPICK